MSSDTVTALVVIGFGAVMCLAVLVVFGLGFFFIIRPNIERSKVVNRNWESFALGKNLTYVQGGRPKISGLYQGRQVKLLVINPDYDFDGPVRVSGRTAKSNFLITRTSTTVKEDALELKVYMRGPFDRAESGQDLGIGDETFDAKFRIHCSSPDRVKSILKPEVQSTLLERQINLLDLHNGTLNLNAIGVESRPEILEAFLELVCRIADGIENR
jgi:hypothetical protein